MSDLFFSGSREHAILVLAVKESQEAPNVGYFGRTALQKVVYFLKALGVPLTYKFEVHHYGPYCDQITSDMELLIADGVLRDKSRKPNYWDYKVGSSELVNQLLVPHKLFLDPHRTMVRSVVRVFGQLQPNELELYATLHYAYRYETAGSSLPTKAQILDRFRDYKGTKFTNAKLDKAFAVMVKAKLITVASN